MESKSKCAEFVRTLHWMLVVGVFSATGCVSGRGDIHRAQEAVCESGQVCTLEGRLSAGHPWEAQLVTDDGCFATAIPESFASVAPRFDGKRVQVVGKAFPQPISTPEEEMFYYQVRGMRVNVNVCRLAVVVFSIDSADGNKWINEAQSPTENKRDGGN